jgi:hypothetical protein
MPQAARGDPIMKNEAQHQYGTRPSSRPLTRKGIKAIIEEKTEHDATYITDLLKCTKHYQPLLDMALNDEKLLDKWKEKLDENSATTILRSAIYKMVNDSHMGDIERELHGKTPSWEGLCHFTPPRLQQWTEHYLNDELELAVKKGVEKYRPVFPESRPQDRMHTGESVTP